LSLTYGPGLPTSLALPRWLVQRLFTSRTGCGVRYGGGSARPRGRPSSTGPARRGGGGLPGPGAAPGPPRRRRGEALGPEVARSRAPPAAERGGASGLGSTPFRASAALLRRSAGGEGHLRPGPPPGRPPLLRVAAALPDSVRARMSAGFPFGAGRRGRPPPVSGSALGPADPLPISVWKRIPRALRTSPRPGESSLLPPRSAPARRSPAGRPAGSPRPRRPPYPPASRSTAGRGAGGRRLRASSIFGAASLDGCVVTRSLEDSDFHAHLPAVVVTSRPFESRPSSPPRDASGPRTVGSRLVETAYRSRPTEARPEPRAARASAAPPGRAGVSPRPPPAGADAPRRPRDRGTFGVRVEGDGRSPPVLRAVGLYRPPSSARPAILKEISRGTSYQATRLVSRRHARLGRDAICTSAPLRASTPLSRGFAPGTRRSSPFGYQRVDSGWPSWVDFAGAPGGRPRPLRRRDPRPSFSLRGGAGALAPPPPSPTRRTPRFVLQDERRAPPPPEGETPRARARRISPRGGASWDARARRPRAARERRAAVPPAGFAVCFTVRGSDWISALRSRFLSAIGPLPGI